MFIIHHTVRFLNSITTAINVLAILVIAIPIVLFDVYHFPLDLLLFGFLVQIVMFQIKSINLLWLEIVNYLA